MNIDKIQAGPELDGLIATRVMEWPSATVKTLWIDDCGCFYDTVDVCPEPHRFNPSTDIATAMQVFLKLSDNDSLYIGKIMASDTFSCYFWDCDTCEDVGCEAESLPLAICRAALKVMQK